MVVGLWWTCFTADACCRFVGCHDQRNDWHYLAHNRTLVRRSGHVQDHQIPPGIPSLHAYHFSSLIILLLIIIKIIIIQGQCLWCWHRDSVIAWVHPVHGMNAEQHQTATDLWTKLTWPSLEWTECHWPGSGLTLMAGLSMWKLVSTQSTAIQLEVAIWNSLPRTVAGRFITGRFITKNSYIQL